MTGGGDAKFFRHLRRRVLGMTRHPGTGAAGELSVSGGELAENRASRVGGGGGAMLRMGRRFDTPSLKGLTLASER